MLTSVPKEIITLGLGFQDYQNIAKNVNRILTMHENNQKDILNRADKELSTKVTVIGTSLLTNMENDREFFREIGHPYANGPPTPDCFKVTLADYLLKNQDKIKIKES